MLAYTYLEKGTFRLTDKPKPVLREPGDALVRVTLSSICTSDLHIKHGSVPRAVPGITVGHPKYFWACRIPVHVFSCVVRMGRKGGRRKSRSMKAEKPESVRR